VKEPDDPFLWKHKDTYLRDFYIPKLNLGCGDRTSHDMINVDLVDGDGVDQVVNLFDLPLPWEPDTFGYIYAGHFLEHVPHSYGGHTELWFPFIENLLRVLKIGGILEVNCPHPLNPEALVFPGHCRLVGLVSFRPWLRSEILHSNQANEVSRCLELIHYDQYRDFKPFLGLEPYHVRKWLHLEVGRLITHRLTFRVLCPHDQVTRDLDEMTVTYCKKCNRILKGL